MVPMTNNQSNPVLNPRHDPMLFRALNMMGVFALVAFGVAIIVLSIPFTTDGVQMSWGCEGDYQFILDAQADLDAGVVEACDDAEVTALEAAPSAVYIAFGILLVGVVASTLIVYNIASRWLAFLVGIGATLIVTVVSLSIVLGDKASVFKESYYWACLAFGVILVMYIVGLITAFRSYPTSHYTPRDAAGNRTMPRGWRDNL